VDNAEPGPAMDTRKWLSLLVLGLGLAIVIIDTTIVNVAIPSIRSEFGASLRQLQWVNSLYSLVFAALIVTWGRIGDQIGRKRLFIAGVATFVVGSALAGSASNISFLIVARAFQGIGAAMTSPSTLSIVSSSFTGRARGVAFGIWGAIAGAAAALGPVLGGWLTTNLSWRWAFLVNLPIGLIAIAGSMILIKESRAVGRKMTFDIPGILFVGLGIGGIVFGLIEGQAYGWWRPEQPLVIGNWAWPSTGVSITPVSFLFGALSLLAFVVWENHVEARGRAPLFDFSLLRFRGFRFGLPTVAIHALGEFGMIFVLSLYLQSVRGLSAFEVGLAVLPFVILTVVVAPLAGVLSSHIGPKWVVTAGMFCEAAAIFILAQILSVDTPVHTVTLVLLLYGLGVGLAIAQLTNVVLSEIPPECVGAGSGANNTVLQVGASMGIAIIGAILTTQMGLSAAAHLQASSSTIPASVQTAVVAALNQSGGGETGAALDGLPAGSENTPMGMEIAHIVAESFVEGARAAAYAASAFVLLGALSSLLIPNTVQRPAHASALPVAET